MFTLTHVKYVKAPPAAVNNCLRSRQQLTAAVFNVS